MVAPIIIVGGGIAGLVFASEAARRGRRVLLLEQSQTLGGLTRSLEINGCLVDLGPHLLHLRDPQVADATRKIVPADQWVKIVRRGKLYLAGHYVDWPLRASSAWQIPPALAARILLDQLAKRPRPTSASFADELSSVYGPTLFHALFEPLGRKFLKEDPTQIHADWAYASIRAATKIEDRSFQQSQQYLVDTAGTDTQRDFNVVRFVMNALRTNLEDEEFYYFKDGFGVLAHAYADDLRRHGGELRRGTTVESLRIDDGRITHCRIDGQEVACDHVVWAGSLKALADRLSITLPPLQYLHTKLVYYFLNPCRMAYQCCYYADPTVSFNRATILSNHAKTIIRNPSYSDVLCVEYTYRSPEAMAQHAHTLTLEVVAELTRLRLIKDRRDIVDVHVENVPYTYPVLTLSYKEHMAAVGASLSRFSNLLTLGRQGRFSYENSDIIIGEVLRHPFFNQADAPRPMDEQPLIQPAWAADPAPEAV